MEARVITAPTESANSLLSGGSSLQGNGKMLHPRVNLSQTHQSAKETVLHPGDEPPDNQSFLFIACTNTQYST